MQRKSVAILIICILMVSCTHKATIISPVGSAGALSPQGMIYALPLTTFRIKVESVYDEVIPGPYAQFAEKYIGISGVPVSPKSEWRIASVDVFSESEADQSAMFAVEPAENLSSDFLQLTSKGLLIPISDIRFQGSDQIGLKEHVLPDKDDFTDLSITPFIVAERTTHYSRVLQDSTFVKVPVHKTIVVEKNIEDKAREAAEFIFSLRKRRFDLLAGDADFVGDGKAVEAVLNEIRRLEHEYITLFTGKTFENNAIHLFDFTPNPESNGGTILFRFSPSKGVISPSDLSGSPVLISATADNEWQGIGLFSELSNEKGVPRTDAIYYRIPMSATIKIAHGNNDLFLKRLTVFQFGPLVRMPSRFILRESGIIHFLPNKK